MRNRHLRNEMAIVGSLFIHGEQSGYELSKSSGVGKTAIYITLNQLENKNRIIARWETPCPNDRPSRKLYSLA